MKISRIATFFICIVLAIFGCSEAPKSTDRTGVEVEFDLDAGGLVRSDGARIIGALRKLLEGSTDPIRVRFVLGDAALTFDVLQAEPEAAYGFSQVQPRRSEDGGRIVAEPIASPPGEIGLDWIHVSKDVAVLRGKKLTDAELTEWFSAYAKNLSAIQERSAMVVDIDNGVESARLFAVLELMHAQGLDRFLVERQTEVDTEQPATHPESDPKSTDKPQPEAEGRPR